MHSAVRARQNVRVLKILIVKFCLRDDHYKFEINRKNLQSILYIQSNIYFLMTLAKS